MTTKSILFFRLNDEIQSIRNFIVSYVMVAKISIEDHLFLQITIYFQEIYQLNVKLTIYLAQFFPLR